MKGWLLLRLLPMSLAGSAVILLVLLFRRLLRRGPKVFSYLLWFGALFRLLCPAEVSLVSLPVSGAMDLPTVSQQEPMQVPEAEWSPGQAEPQKAPAPAGSEAGAGWIAAAERLWLAGALALALYAACSLLSLRRRLVGSVPLRDNIRLADHIQSPFVLGLLRPRIYLPADLPQREREYLILHEQIHIRRGDHLVKLLAFGALAVHWFNPLVWLAFRLMEQDMEMSCDEAAIKRADRDIRAEYAASLLKFAAGGVSRALPGFGEGETKSRVRNIIAYQKPSRKMRCGASILLAAAFILAGCGLQQGAPQEQAGSWMERYDVPEDFMRQTVCAFVLSVQGDRLEADPAEYIELEDQERVAELNLTEKEDMPDGYYIYNPDQQPETWTLTQDTQYIFIDWGRDFVEDPETEDIVICTQEQALFERYLATYDQSRPGMPFFFEVEEGIVRRVIEYPFA